MKYFLIYKYTQISAIFKNTKQNFYFNLFLSLIPKLVFSFLQFPLIVTDTHFFLSLSIYFLCFPGDSGEEFACQCRRQETQVWSLGQEDPLEDEMAIHSSILAWKIPCTGEPGGLRSMGSQRVRHNWTCMSMQCTYIFHPSIQLKQYLVNHKWPLHVQFVVFSQDSHSLNSAGFDQLLTKHLECFQ